MSQRQLRPIYEDSQAYETNNETSDATDEFEDILVPDEMQHVMPSVPQKSKLGFPRLNLMQLPGPRTDDLIGGMTRLNVENGW